MTTDFNKTKFHKTSALSPEGLGIEFLTPLSAKPRAELGG